MKKIIELEKQGGKYALKKEGGKYYEFLNSYKNIEKDILNKEIDFFNEVKKYTIGTLMLENVLYESEHIINEKDVEKINRYIDFFKERLNAKTVSAGDVVFIKIQGKNKYYNAHIESVDVTSGICYICTSPYIPFTFLKDKNLSFSTSGGYWADVKIEDLKMSDEIEKSFCTWGSCGARGNGGLNFRTEVRKWELSKEACKSFY